MSFLISKEVVSIAMIVVAVILILNGGAIVVLGSTDKKRFGRYIGLVTLVGGLVDSVFGLLIIILSITLK